MARPSTILARSLGIPTNRNDPFGNPSDTAGEGDPFTVGAVRGQKFRAPGTGSGLPTFGGISGGLTVEDTRAARDELVGDLTGILGGDLGLQTGRFDPNLTATINQLLSGQGFDPRTLRGLQTRNAEREAGIRQAGQGRVSGNPRINEASRLAILSQLQGESGSRLSSADLNVALQDQQLRAQNQATGVQGSLGAANISASQQSLLAQLVGSLGLPLGGARSGNTTGPGRITGGGITGSAGGTGGAGFVAPKFGHKSARRDDESQAEQIIREAAFRRQNPEWSS